MEALSHWKKQLITKEDPFHVHKSLGILVLASIIFRFSNAGSSDMGFLAWPRFTFPTIVLHAMLSVSSMQFKIPSKRIKTGYRIWPEYRLHTIVFAFRSLIFMAIAHIEKVNDLPRNPWLYLGLVVSTCAAADLASALCEQQSSTIRDLKANAYVHFFFSAVQLFVTTMCIFGPGRRLSSHFMTLSVIQFNAFMMTLQRKNLAPQWFLVTIYGFLLVFGVYHGIHEVELQYGADHLTYPLAKMIGFAAVLMRMALPKWIVLQNKYVMWTVLGVSLEYIRTRPNLLDHEETVHMVNRILWWYMLLPYALWSCHQRSPSFLRQFVDLGASLFHRIQMFASLSPRRPMHFTERQSIQ